jgi:hypothetical protein
MLIEDHIEGTWELKEYLRNDVIETSEIDISNYMENYSLDGTYIRTYTDGKQEFESDTGEFTINEELKSLHISDVSSISDFSELHSTLSSSTVDVILLDETEFVYSFENGGDKHEFRFLRLEE